jgi:hypothetical protein
MSKATFRHAEANSLDCSTCARVSNRLKESRYLTEACVGWAVAEGSLLQEV